MASLTRLRRRHQAWRRYRARYQALGATAGRRGYWRAWDAVLAELARRDRIARERFEPVETDWCWSCGDDECDGDCEGLPLLRPIVDEVAFARLGIL